MTTWKDRLWQLFLVITFGVVLSVCTNNSITGKKSGLAYADFKPSDVTAVMICNHLSVSSNVVTFSGCDASDSTSLSGASGIITLGDAVSAGWRPCGMSMAGSSRYGVFSFCK